MENELFERMPVPRAYMKLALPVVLSMGISMVYNIVDTFFIAQTGDMDLVAGVSLAAPVFTLMIALGDIFGLGGSSSISRLFGEKKDEDAKRLSVFCFYAAIVCGLLVSALLLLFRAPILGLLGADQNTLLHASEYFTWIAIGAPFIILTLTPSNILRTEGLANDSMIGSLIGSVVNIILDPIFISVLGMGAAGAAIATVIGNICTDIYYTWVLLKKSERLSVIPKGLYIRMQEMKGILAIGIPASLTNLMQTISLILTNLFLLPYGNDKVAAIGIVMKASMIVTMVMIGFAFGGQPLIGYNYGAKNKRRLKEILKFAYCFECTMAAVLSVILALAAPKLLGIFVQDAEIIATGTTMLRIQMIAMVFMGIILVTTCTFQSAGKAVGALLLSVSRQGVLFVIVLLIASQIAGYYGVLCTQFISDVLTTLMAVVLLRRSKII